MRRLNLQGFTYQTKPLPVLHRTFEAKIYVGFLNILSFVCEKIQEGKIIIKTDT